MSGASAGRTGNTLGTLSLSAYIMDNSFGLDSSAICSEMGGWRRLGGQWVAGCGWLLQPSPPHPRTM